METTLRGLVYGRYKSIRAFAKVMGWNRTKTTDIVNLKQEPRISELQDMAVALDASVEKLASFFLPNESQKRDTEAEEE